jgi:hypothetical protein
VKSICLAFSTAPGSFYGSNVLADGVIADGCTGVICGIGNGAGVGNVVGGCPPTTCGGGGSGGGSRVIGGGVGATGSEAGCAAVEIRDGATGFESQPTDAHDANTRDRQTVNREITHLGGLSCSARADLSMRLIGYLLELTNGCRRSDHRVWKNCGILPILTMLTCRTFCGQSEQERLPAEFGRVAHGIPTLVASASPRR